MPKLHSDPARSVAEPKSYGPRIVFYERLSPLGEKHSIQLVAWKMDVVELPPWITSSSSMAALLCFAWVVECWAIFSHQHGSAYTNGITGQNPIWKIVFKFVCLIWGSGSLTTMDNILIIYCPFDWLMLSNFFPSMW